ncbi:MAG: DinB family protein [Acidimicrobiales bacterium]
MDVAEVLVELYGRVPPLARQAVDGLDLEQLNHLPAPGTNSIAWLIWHIARVQDHHMSEMFDVDQIWVGGGWASRFGLEPDPSDIGYGHSAADVAAVSPDEPTVLVAYLDAVFERTCQMIGEVTPGDLDRIVDHGWDPPVTMGVRLVSIADDNLQHVGQAAYLRGLLEA